MNNNRLRVFVRTALILGIAFASYKIVGAFVKRRNEYRLMSAIYLNNVKEANALMTSGVDINCSNSSGTTPLIIATLNRNYALIASLVRSGVRVNETDHKGLNALYYSVYEDDLPLAQQLIAKGANVNTRYTDGTNVLMVAVYRHDVSMLKVLLSNGADVNVHSKHGITPLRLAKRLGINEAV